MPEEAKRLLKELEMVAEGAPKDTRSFLQSIGPFAAPPLPIDPLREASVYLAYERIDGAREMLSQALQDPERVKELDWLENGEAYALEVLVKLEHISKAQHAS